MVINVYVTVVANIEIVGMAGINLGPFSELNSRILTGSAKELFDFSNPNSSQSKAYITALRVVIAHGAKLLLVASIDDQLVPLEVVIRYLFEDLKLCHIS